ncbi:uncharacterized protein LOC128592719 [Nycticebus coucang]|uniref:uncharacterized protein LOC128592719 n=1 Tax=Nycticebus coucang TaxID=9470 RepID=UPI00234D2AF0|nr:uncharacterized protein LOC128592719 [Nycticebus coucang]
MLYSRRPGPRPGVRVCARVRECVCASECVRGVRARAGVGARGERPENTLVCTERPFAAAFLPSSRRSIPVRQTRLLGASEPRRRALRVGTAAAAAAPAVKSFPVAAGSRSFAASASPRPRLPPPSYSDIVALGNLEPESLHEEKRAGKGQRLRRRGPWCCRRLLRGREGGAPTPPTLRGYE